MSCPCTVSLTCSPLSPCRRELYGVRAAQSLRRLFAEADTVSVLPKLSLFVSPSRRTNVELFCSVVDVAVRVTVDDPVTAVVPFAARPAKEKTQLASWITGVPPIVR